MNRLDTAQSVAVGPHPVREEGDHGAAIFPDQPLRASVERPARVEVGGRTCLGQKGVELFVVPITIVPVRAGQERLTEDLRARPL